MTPELLPERTAARPPVTFGSPLPKLDVTRWLVREPRAAVPGQVLVVSFWTPSTTPARDSLLILSKLATDINDPRLEIMAISNDSAEAITPLLEAPPLSARVHFPIGCDPDSSAFHQLMTSSWQTSMPMAFVFVDGLVQWIGPPRNAEPVVRAVLEGRWNSEARRAEFERDMAVKQRASEFDESISTHLDRKEFQQALDVVGRMESDPDAGLAREGQLLRVAVLQQGEQTAEAIAAAKSLMRSSRDWYTQAELAKMLVSELFTKPDISLATIAALGATTLSKEKEAQAFIALADVQARAGQHDLAIRSLQRAATLAMPEDRDEIDARLAAWTPPSQAAPKDSANPK